MAGVVKRIGAIPELEAEHLRSDGSRVFLNWDALSDSIWQGFLDLHERKIAVIWPVGDTGLNADLTIALGILEEASVTLVDSRYTVGNPKELTVLLI